MNFSQTWSSEGELRTWRNRVFMISTVILLLIATFAQQAGSGQTLYHVRGTVVHSLTGQPVSQVRVFLWRTPDRREREVFMTGADGKFWFDDIPAGKYALGEAKPGFVRQDFEQHEFYSSAIVVGAGLSADNLVFRIAPAGAISGQITDEQNEPVRDAQVILFQSRMRGGEKAVRRINQTTSDDRGQYIFGDLAPGTFFVVVYARPWYAPFTAFTKDSADSAESQASRVPTDVAYPVAYFSGATDSKQATPITLGAGDHVTADFNLTTMRSIHLRVRLPKANPYAGCSVSASPITFDNADVPIPISAQTLMKKPGEAEVSGLSPGPYHLLIVIPGKQPKIYKQDVDLQSDMEIDPTSSDQVGSISGQVSMANGLRPPVGLIILLRNVATEENAGARVLPDGRFEFNPSEAISPGRYEVAIASDSLFVTSISATGARLLGRNLEIHGSDSVQLSLVISKGVGTVEGTAVSGADEQPVAGAMILLIPDDPKNNAVLVRRDQSDSDGTFILNSVVPGRYRLLAIRNGWDLEWMNPAVLKPYLLQAERVDILQNGRYKWKIRVQ